MILLSTNVDWKGFHYTDANEWQKDHLIDFQNDLALTDTMDEFFYAYDRMFKIPFLRRSIYTVY